MKTLFFLLSFLFLFSNTLEAQRCGSRWCCACRYSSHQCELNENILYGYVDNLNYPDPTYRLPVNCCFNYCPPCPPNNYNRCYFQNCMYYTQQKRAAQAKN